MNLYDIREILQSDDCIEYMKQVIDGVPRELMSVHAQQFETQFKIRLDKFVDDKYDQGFHDAQENEYSDGYEAGYEKGYHTAEVDTSEIISEKNNAIKKNKELISGLKSKTVEQKISIEERDKEIDSLKEKLLIAYEKGHKKGYEEGYEEGYENGYSDGEL